MTENGFHTLTASQNEIIKTLLYFDVFKYPLTAKELFENSAISISYDEFLRQLENLREQKILKKEKEFYLNPERTTADIQNRIEGNRGASEIMPTAYKFSKKIASFPFVEGICLSGALSKNYYDEKGDIDYFIFTKPNRLWICRTLLILRYKLLPKNQRHFWCTNYFISSDSLEIPEKNSFTGTELAYLKPVVNYEVYQKFLQENSWYKQRYPNKDIASSEHCINLSTSNLKRLVEYFLNGRLGNWLDNLLLDITLRHWRKKYPEMNDTDFELQFRSRKDVCKRHTKGFQNKTLNQWQNKTDAFEQKYKASLNGKTG